ncbi:MAG: ribonuclease III [Phycisphaerae bacterium]
MEPAATQRCQTQLGYEFKNPDLLEIALTHASVAASRTLSNERMEFLGDSVLGLVVCQELYEAFPDSLEGEMTRVKSAVVSRQTCAEVADEIGLPEMLMLGKGMSQPELPTSVAAAVFESLIGAIYIDGGLEPAQNFILTHLRNRIDEAMASEHQQNYKAKLQQYAQRRWGRTPEYQLLDEKGPDHSKCFEIAVAVDGRHFPSAWGPSKKESEQKAALAALIELGLED